MSLSSRSSPDVEVVIIGGGPAGAALGAYLGKAGIDCLVLEKEIFPRQHVGESLVPASTRVFKELGLIEKLEQAGFLHKYGAVWTTHKNVGTYQHDWRALAGMDEYDARIQFSERSQLGVDQNYTYHVDRGEFDLLLLKHAEELGADVLQGASAKQVIFSESSWPVVEYAIGRVRKRVSTRIVADASGRNVLLGKQLDLRVTDPVFDQFAIHNWFEGYERAKSDSDGEDIYIHFLPITNSWVWQIPISNKVTSIGVVTQKKNVKGKTKEGRFEFFWDCIDSRPELAQRLRTAKMLRPFTIEADYSYAMKQITGDHFLLVGDAARFVDPIFSSGVSIALNAARFASLDIAEAIKNNDYRRSSFSAYEAVLRCGARNWHEFISVYYRLNVLFTYYVNDKKYRLAIIKLLQGDVYDEEEPEVLRLMREAVSAVESNKDHVLHGLLGDLTSYEFRPKF
ncbi:MAG TPA: NAD(P)/FAD-dependent oxidoreductase [Bacteroidetes bacterium]|nr:NAD(P)/FAD-dependent oxidoreductase [Bacteroidota bacterium]HEX05668.1 NAD(P)/FAD-dependent oxidoreductase [Bacteroidota bacterium]